MLAVFHVVVQRWFISVTVPTNTNTLSTDGDFLCFCSLPESFYFRHANEILTLGTLAYIFSLISFH